MMGTKQVRIDNLPDFMYTNSCVFSPFILILIYLLIYQGYSSIGFQKVSDHLM